jgi:hypothetical protein
MTLSITTLDVQCCYTGCHYAERHGIIYTSLVRILKKRASYLKVGTNARKTVYKIAYDSDSTLLVLTNLGKCNTNDIVSVSLASPKLAKVNIVSATVNVIPGYAQRLCCQCK